MLKDTVVILMFYTRFKSSAISNIHSSKTIGPIFMMTYLIVNDLRNEIEVIDIKSVDILYVM
jgi:hypothetical protein